MSATGAGTQGFRVGRVLGRSFLVLGQNVVPVGLLALAMLSVPYVIGLLLGFRHSGGPFFDFPILGWTWRESLALTLQSFLTTCLGAVLAISVYESLRGHHPGARALVETGLARLPAVLAIVVVVTVPHALLAAVVSVRVDEPWPMPWVSTFGPYVVFPAIIVVSAFIFLAWVFLFVAIPAAVVERLGVLRSIERSIGLIWGSTMRVIGLLLTVWAMELAVFVAPILILEWAGIEVTAAHYPLLVWPDLLFAAFAAALWAIVAAVAYHDLRVSRDRPDPARVATGFE